MPLQRSRHVLSISEVGLQRHSLALLPSCIVGGPRHDTGMYQMATAALKACFRP